MTNLTELKEKVDKLFLKETGFIDSNAISWKNVGKPLCIKAYELGKQETLSAVGKEIDFDIKNFGYSKNAMGQAMQFYLMELKERLQIPTEKEQ
jgi:hypothetical protein